MRVPAIADAVTLHQSTLFKKRQMSYAAPYKEDHPGAYQTNSHPKCRRSSGLSQRSGHDSRD